VAPRQKEGPIAGAAVLLLADAKYGLLSYAFSPEQWNKVDAAIREALSSQETVSKGQN
jgi:hypothetical protein